MTWHTETDYGGTESVSEHTASQRGSAHVLVIGFLIPGSPFSAQHISGSGIGTVIFKRASSSFFYR